MAKAFTRIPQSSSISMIIPVFPSLPPVAVKNKRYFDGDPSFPWILKNPQNEFEDLQINLILMLSYIPLFLISAQHSINQFKSHFPFRFNPLFSLLNITTPCCFLMCDLHQPLVSPTQIQRHDLVLVARRGHLPRRCARVARSSEPPQRHETVATPEGVAGRISTYISRCVLYTYVCIYRICYIVYCTCIYIYTCVYAYTHIVLMLYYMYILSKHVSLCTPRVS